MAVNGIGFIGGLRTLGTVQQQEVWDEAKQIYIYTKGDQSVLILLYGVATILLTILMILVWRGTLRSAYKAECIQKAGMHVNTFAEDLKSFLHENLYRLFMTPPTAFIFVFTVLPLVFMICMAFTNYSRIGNHLMLFDWVGLIISRHCLIPKVFLEVPSGLFWDGRSSGRFLQLSAIIFLE